MQVLADARDVNSHAAGESRADPAAVDAVLTVSRFMVAVATRSLGAAAEETAIAQYRALVVLVSRGPRRMVDLAEVLSCGTIYTTRLLRRGTDIDQAAPWRAVAGLKITDVMRPFLPALPVPPDGSAPAAHGGSPVGNGRAPEPDAVPGPVTYRHDPQALFASESLSQARQLEVYGRDGLPALSPDGQRVEGWVTGASVLRALARQIAGSQAGTVHAQAAADWEHHEAEAMLQHPPAPLSGYRMQPARGSEAPWTSSMPASPPPALSSSPATGRTSRRSPSRSPPGPASAPARPIPTGYR
jgi:CIC family chloride channel protein